jgi:hypothetical protein
MNAVHSLIRAWTSLYTLALPSEVRARRRAEIESDLWESAHDRDDAGRGLLLRLLRGMPADILWRLETATGQGDRQVRAIAGAIGGLALLVAVIWSFARQPVTLPAPPRRPMVGIGRSFPHPPPPPPQPRQAEPTSARTRM